jgi:pyruvate dehydrogenase E1 component
VTSYQLLRREALSCERYNRLHPEAEPKVPYITAQLKDAKGPAIAVSDYMTLVQDQIARWVPNRYIALGTDGFGMRDTREALRRHFEVEAECIVVAVMDALRQEGKIDAATWARVIQEQGVNPDRLYSAEV